MVTATPHPTVITIQPESRPFDRARTTFATTPSPSRIRIIVPAASAMYAFMCATAYHFDSATALCARDFLLCDAALHGAAARRKNSSSSPRRQSGGVEHLPRLLPDGAAARVPLRPRAEHACAATMAVEHTWRGTDPRECDAASSDRDRRAG